MIVQPSAQPSATISAQTGARPLMLRSSRNWAIPMLTPVISPRSGSVTSSVRVPSSTIPSASPLAIPSAVAAIHQGDADWSVAQRPRGAQAAEAAADDDDARKQPA